jgi:hypothetical protein
MQVVLETHSSFKSTAPSLHLVQISGVLSVPSQQAWHESSAALHQHFRPIESSVPTHSMSSVGAPSALSGRVHFKPKFPLPDTVPPACSQYCVGMHCPLSRAALFLHRLQTAGTPRASTVHLWQSTKVGVQEHVLPFDESLPSHFDGLPTVDVDVVMVCVVVVVHVPHQCGHKRRISPTSHIHSGAPAQFSKLFATSSLKAAS